MQEIKPEDLILAVIAEAKAAMFLHNHTPKEAAYDRLSILEEIIKNVRNEKEKASTGAEHRLPRESGDPMV